MVIGRVGVEVGAARLDDDFAKQARIRELMKGIVNRRKRYLDRRTCRLGVQLLSGDMALSIFEQEACQGEALASGPQARRAQPLQGGRGRRRHHHATNIMIYAEKINNRYRTVWLAQSPVCRRPTNSRTVGT